MHQAGLGLASSLVDRLLDPEAAWPRRAGAADFDELRGQAPPRSANPAQRHQGLQRDAAARMLAAEPGDAAAPRPREDADRGRAACSPASTRSSTSPRGDGAELRRRTRGARAERRRRDLVRTCRRSSDEVAAPADGCRILVVDDNESNRDLLSRRLIARGPRRRHGRVRRRSALDVLASSEPFDLVLLDLMMPGHERLSRCSSG